MSHELPPSQTARWKLVSDEELRALCGKSGCPGCLGHLLSLVDFDRLDTTADEEVVAEYRARWPEIEAALTRKKASSAEIAELRANLEDALGRLEAHIEASKAAAATWPMDQQRVFATWAMTAPVGPDHKPKPIFYGYPDSGYRISFRGKRTKKGTRVARRPFVANTSDFDAHLRRHGLEYPWQAVGQSPMPPTKIWCPVCDSLNFVPLPDGFVLATTDAPAVDDMI